VISSIEGDGVRVSSERTDVPGVFAVLVDVVSRCVSIAVASLSLSLSLSWPGLLASRAFRRPGWAARSGRRRRVGLARVVVLGVLVVSGVFGMGGVALAAPAEPVVDSEGASAMGPFGATLEAQVNPGEQETTCVRFEYGTSTAYGSSVPCANSALGSGGEDTLASAIVAGLRPGTEYHFRVVVENLSSPLGGTDGADQSFTTPLVLGGAESLSRVSDTGATLSAPVDPGGVATTYYFEYGPTAGYGSRTPGVISYADEQVVVTARLTGLIPASEYHFRIVTESEGGVREEGSDIVFRTLPVGVVGLPDRRGFEMVTPVDNEGANVYVPEVEGTGANESNGTNTRFPFEASLDGDAVAYIADATPDGGGEGLGGAGLGSQYVARRSAAGGWTQASIQPQGYLVARYEGFSSDLSVGFLASCSRCLANPQLPGLAPGAPEGGYYVLYSRGLGEGIYQSLFTTIPPNRLPAVEGLSFGVGGKIITDGKTLSGEAPVYAGVSGDLGQVLFEANDALIPGEGALERELQADAKQEVEEGKNSNYLYDSSTGGLGLVDVLPDGKVESNATFGGPPIGAPRRNPPAFDHAISEDGRYIYWTAQSTGMLYVREDGARTVPVSAGAGPAQFWGATGNGVYALYTEGERLYRFDVNHPETTEALADVGAGVEGVIGASENDEDVYFVASGELAAGAVGGQPNLYLERVGGGVTFIATLSPEDGVRVSPYENPEGNIGDWSAGLGQRTAEVTPDGKNVVFMSNQPLKAQGFPAGYANEGKDEVYVYDTGLGKLFCASCSQSREPGSSAYLPVSWSDTYIPRWMSEDGSRVFFDSGSPLVSQGSNGQQNVYEWEREGSGSCSEGTGADGGCVYLLSGGSSSTASWLAGESANGSDVFIITRAELTGQNTNGTYDLFDARVGGVPPTAPAGCSGAGCPSTPGAAPGFAAPSSVAYSGAGNVAPPAVLGGSVRPKVKVLTRAQKLAAALKACQKGPRRARSLCEARARRRYGPAGKTRKAARSAKKGRR
jgi:hypothetical protein